ncbi:sensor histidine kinase [Pedobacter kyonggii]|uniref:Signal transduction histidine kinase internal region domain-containing protein n=1 Tax=Pedobacter kyonggii TaxID=1926871 RepID=A0A4V2JH75_9SPHI|nr:histidine kinase [Pedobacter kyonggii]TBO44271.1 hypothetical protein EYS08_02880 [Pedobacter kyonggii]
MTKKILQWAKCYRIHLIGWSLYIISEILLIGFAVGRFGSPVGYLLHYTLNIILFYSNTALLRQNAVKASDYRWLILTLTMVGEILLFLGLKILIDVLIKWPDDWVKTYIDYLTIPNLLQTLWRALLFIGLSCFYFMFLRYEEERRKKELAERQKYENYIHTKELEVTLHETTNAYLKAQINPHLIFNILGFIHDSVLRTDEKTAQAVIDLSELMRFAINSRDGEAEPTLSGEIQQVETLIRLYRLRFKERLFVEFIYPSEAKEIRFIPLVLLTLVENLFKHGDIHDAQDPAKINISLSNAGLRISTNNKIKTGFKAAGFHKGLENIEKRLKLSYGDHAKLEFTAGDDKHFSVMVCSNKN